MQFTALVEDDDAVSPVIGVILMVAITVILAAVIGTFVLGLAPDGSNPPQAQFSFDEPGNQNVTITHDSGESVQTSNLNVTATSSVDLSGQCQTTGGNTDGWPSTEISAGEQCQVSIGSQEGTLRVVWESDDGSNSATLASYDYDFS